MDHEAIGKGDGLGEGLFSMLLDLLPDYFYVNDSDMRVVYVNKTAADYFGRPKAELVGKYLEDLEPDKEFARQVIELGRRIMISGEPRITDQAPYHEPDGTLSYHRRYDIPFRHPVTGEPMLLGLARDVTDQVEREAQEKRLAAMHREMQIAQEIQRSLLPRELQTDWIELAGLSEPTAYAGGDFHDWLRTPDGSVVLALGDVSGHGVGPAMVGAECRAYWRGLAQSLTLRDAVLRLNELIQADLSGDRFVTFAAARLSPDGTLEFFSAGHGPLVLRRAEGAVELLDPHTFPLGVLPELPRKDVTVRRLAPGDTLLIFSDGITEIRNPEGRQWSMDGFLEGLARHRGLSGSDLLRAIDRDNLGFANGEPAADDRTVVVATFRGA